jgi:flavorubredoxin
MGNYSEGVREKATGLYGSMYGIRDFCRFCYPSCRQKRAAVEVFDINSSQISYILPSIWKNQGVIICARPMMVRFSLT